MKLTPDLIAEIAKHAAEAMPEECCGFIVAAGKRRRFIVRARNMAPSVAENPVNNRTNRWKISPADQIAAEQQGDVIAVYHSHPNGRAIPSEADLVCCEKAGLPFVIYAHPLGEVGVFEPKGYRAPLRGREFVHGVTDCYALVRDYYFEELGIEIPDFEREDGWWEKPDGPDLYMDNVLKAGFRIVSKDWRDAKPNDVLLMRVFSKLGKVNHAAVLLDGMRIIQHLPKRLSGRETFSQYWQQCVACVVRHEKLMTP